MDVLGLFTEIIWECVGVSLAYGLISMAILQFMKDMFWREDFNARQFYRRFRGKDGAAQELIQLAAAGDSYALFGLTIEKLAGQISLAANTVIESPKRYKDLLALMANGADPSDLEILDKTEGETLNADAPGDDDTARAENAKVRVHFADARSRVSHQIQRNIDSLQLSATQRWTRFNQGWSLVISCLIGTLPVLLKHYLPSNLGLLTTARLLLTSLVLSFVGGLLAPILRDLAANASQKD